MKTQAEIEADIQTLTNQLNELEIMAKFFDLEVLRQRLSSDFEGVSLETYPLDLKQVINRMDKILGHAEALRCKAKQIKKLAKNGGAV